MKVLSTVLMVIGFGCVLWGCWSIAPVVAWLVGGLTLCVMGLGAHRKTMKAPRK